MALSLNQLLEQSKEPEKKLFNIDGVGEVELYELSYGEFSEFAKQGEREDEDEPIRWVIRLFNGPDHEITDADINTVKNTLSMSQVRNILEKVTAFNSVDEAGKPSEATTS